MASRLSGALAGLVGLAVTVAGCGDGQPSAAESDRAAATADGAQRARERVQQYLDAMVAKDPLAGRAQLCPALHAAFDTAATAANGDFAAHFTVPTATVTGVQPAEGGYQVSTSVVVETGDDRTGRALLFTVLDTDSGWCIAAETATDATTAPQATGSPTG